MDEANKNAGTEQDLELEGKDAEGVKGGGVSLNLGDVKADFGGGNADASVGGVSAHSGADGYDVKAGQGRSSLRAKGGWGRLQGAGKRLRRK